MAVAVVERFKQEAMYGLSARAKKVAVVERWRFDCIILKWCPIPKS